MTPQAGAEPLADREGAPIRLTVASEAQLLKEATLTFSSGAEMFGL
jgi:hypothetical protein